MLVSFSFDVLAVALFFFHFTVFSRAIGQQRRGYENEISAGGDISLVDQAEGCDKLFGFVFMSATSIRVQRFLTVGRPKS